MLPHRTGATLAGENLLYWIVKIQGCGWKHSVTIMKVCGPGNLRPSAKLTIYVLGAGIPLWFWEVDNWGLLSVKEWWFHFCWLRYAHCRLSYESLIALQSLEAVAPIEKTGEAIKVRELMVRLWVRHFNHWYALHKPLLWCCSLSLRF